MLLPLQARNSRLISHLQVLSFLMLRHIVCELSVVLLSLLTVCLGCSVIWQPTQPRRWPLSGQFGHRHRHTGWLGGSWLWVAWHRSAPGSSSAGSSGFSPQNTTLNYRTEKAAARIYIHVFCMYTISIYRFNTSQGDVKASGCSFFS